MKISEIKKQVKEITVSMGRTVQVVQYEPVNYHLSMKMEVSEGDDITDVTKKLRRVVAKEIHDWEMKMKGEKVPAKESNLIVCSRSGCGKQLPLEQAERTEDDFDRMYCVDCEAEFSHLRKIKDE